MAQAIALAVTEACSNVVVHAHRHTTRPGEMTVALERPDDHVCVYVVDDGIGMQLLYAPTSSKDSLDLMRAWRRATSTVRRPTTGSS